MAKAVARVPTQSRSRAKVDRALLAARDLLEREGVDSLTLPRVAEQAGVSVGALYQYLPDREAIIGTLFAVYHERYEALMGQVIEQVRVEPVDDPVHVVLEAVARIYREQAGPRALRAGLQSAAHTEATRAHKERMVAHVHELLVVTGLRAEGDSLAVARTLFHAADSVMHEAFHDVESGDPEILAQLETMLRHYLESVAAPAG